MNENKLILRDILAIDRTKLANERTFLAYFRTFMVFLSSGLAIIKLDLLKEIEGLGYILMIIAPLLLLIGILRFYHVRRHIRKYLKGEVS